MMNNFAKLHFFLQIRKFSANFLEKSVLMLPKSFSMLEYLTKEQLMDLKRRVDDVAEKIEE